MLSAFATVDRTFLVDSSWIVTRNEKVLVNFVLSNTVKSPETGSHVSSPFYTISTAGKNWPI
jgi:hypothetical protein